MLKFGYANSTTANNDPNHMLESKHVQKSLQGHDPVLYCSSSQEANLLDLASQNLLVIESCKMHSSPLWEPTCTCPHQAPLMAVSVGWTNSGCLWVKMVSYYSAHQCSVNIAMFKAVGRKQCMPCQLKSYPRESNIHNNTYVLVSLESSQKFG